MNNRIRSMVLGLMTLALFASSTTYVRADQQNSANLAGAVASQHAVSDKALLGNYRNTEASTQETGNTAEDTTANITEDAELTEEEMLEMESMTLFSSMNPTFLLSYSADTSYSDNHGLRSGIPFYKYEIDGNKYDTNNVEYIVIHDTGNTRAGADAMAHYQYFASGDRDSSAHYFVDSKQVVQIIDDSEGSWHSGVKYKTYATPISNHNSIGIEMCINSDGNYDQTVQNTIDLSAYLLYTHGLSIDRLVRHYDANGKQCPMTMSASNWSMWNEFVAAVRSKLATYYVHGSGSDTESSSPVWYYNNILGSSYLSADTLAGVILSNNSSISSEDAYKVAESYLNIGSIYGVRGDIAFFQAMLETGYLKYGGEVDPSWHNYCGLKNQDATGYAHYSTIEEGVEAHIQHLYCYASVAGIPSGRASLDPRFFDFLRGSVSAWEELGGRWAVPGYDPGTYSSLEEARNAHRSYGDIIIALYVANGGTGVTADGVISSQGSTDSYWDDPIYSGSAAGARAVLAYGQSGSDIKEIQGYLKTIGYSFVEVNGSFDDATLRSILDFQRRCSLDADGVVGEDTWKWVINTYVTSVQSGLGAVDVSTVATLEQLKDPNFKQEVTAIPETPPVTPQTSTNTQTTVSVTLTEKTGIAVSGRALVHNGSNGDDVAALQQLLNELGYGLVVDGVFGSGTENAVLDFQRKNSLEVDGYVGQMTWSKLGSITVTTTQQTSQPTVTPTVPETTTPSQNTASQGSGISVSGRSLVFMGSAGNDVTALQQILNHLGYSLVVDGIFGNGTNGAVKDFQTKHQLDADGYVGQLTWAKLGEVDGSTSGNGTTTQTQTTSQPASSTTQPGEMLRYGSTGDSVVLLQNLLNQNGASLEEDGVFGGATFGALTAFQSAHGLDADGVCGPLTWAKLQ